jgi:azurin
MRFDTKMIKVSAHKLLTIGLINKSTDATMPHNIVFIQSGMANDVGQSGLNFKENAYVNPENKNVIAHSPLVQINETAFFSFTTPAAGNYEFICSYPGHWGMMKGKFITQ